MSRWFARLCVVLAVMAPASRASALEPVGISASSVTLGYTPIYVAQTQGFFEKLGLDVKITLSTSGPASVAAAMSGDVATVLGGATTMIAARKAGGDVVMFGALSTVFGSNLVVSKKWAESHKLSAGSGYKERIVAMKGATIAITAPGGGNDQLIRFLAPEGGLDADRDMTIITIAETSAMLVAFSQGRVDALSVSSPTSNLAVRDFDAVWLFNVNRGEVEALRGYFGATIAAGGAWLRKNPQNVQSFIKALEMAVDMVRDPARTNQARDAVYKAYFPQMDTAFYNDVWKDIIESQPVTPRINRKMVEGVIDFSNRFAKDKMDYGLVDGSFVN